MKGLQKVTSHAWLTCNTVEDSWASATDCYFFRCLLSDHISFWVSRHAGLSCRTATPKAHLQQGILTRRMNEWTIVQKQRKSRVRVVVVTKGDKPEGEIHYQTKGLSCLTCCLLSVRVLTMRPHDEMTIIQGGHMELVGIRISLIYFSSVNKRITEHYPHW